MLTDAELEYAAQVAERFPPGQQGAWFSRVPFGFFEDPDDDVAEAAAVLWLHPTWDEYGDPAVRLACLRARLSGWPAVGWEDLIDAWQALEAAVPGDYARLLHENPPELARRLRAAKGKEGKSG